jgi:hypothetical protein
MEDLIMADAHETLARQYDKRAEIYESRGKHDKAAKFQAKAAKARANTTVEDLSSKSSDTRLSTLPTAAPGDEETLEDFAKRFKVEATENIATAGFGTTAGLKYRWTVTDNETERPIKVGYSVSIRDAYRQGDAYIAKQYKKHTK